jgi:uncharacterized membrane protein
MLKKTFLKRLETSLSPIGEEEVSRIIKKYDKLIDEEVKKGKDEKNVVSSLGSVDLISKIYLDDKEEVKTESKEHSKHEKSTSTVDNILDGMINFIDDTFKNVDRDLAKRILLILCFIFIGFVSVSLIRIPFRIIDYTGRNILTYFFDNIYFYRVVGSLWSFGLGICFFVFIIWLVVKYVNKIVNRYAYVDTSKNNNAKGTTQSAKEEKERAVKKNTDASVFDVLFIILKVFAIIVTIPLLMTEVGLVIALFVVISLIISGVVLYGPMIIILGFIIFISAILNVIFDVILKGGIK